MNDSMLHRLQRSLRGLDYGAPGPALRSLVEAGLDALPQPGQGRTLERWRALARVAAHDLPLLKLYEGHTDALATLAELNAPAPPRATLGLWAAETPDARVHLEGNVLRGTKAWCSGAEVVDYALLTAWRGDEGPWLALVSLREPNIHVDARGWKAVGMAATRTASVAFDGVAAQVVGRAGEYLQRPGFWHGAAGIASCWLGAAETLAHALRKKATRSSDPHLLAHLGAVDAALLGARSTLHYVATRIDERPHESSELLARGARAVVEDAVERILRHSGRALGAAPFCMSEQFARHVADLTVFVRQSHAERDLAALGNRVIQEEQSWTL